MRWSAFILAAAASALGQAVSAPPDSAAEQAQARAYLKQRLIELNQTYPFAAWERSLESLHQELQTFYAAHGRVRAYAPELKPELIRLSTQLDSLQAVRPKVQALIREMYVQVMTGRVVDLFRRDGKTISPAGRDAFYRTLKPYEAGSLRPKTDFLAHLVALDKGFNETYSQWLYYWAGATLPPLIDQQIKQSDFAAREAERQDLQLKIDYWARQTDSDAAQSSQHLRELESDVHAHSIEALSSLSQLQMSLQPDMLFSDLLEQAQNQNLSFTVDAEENVEAALAMRQPSLQKPIRDKIAAWKNLEPRLQAELARADAAKQRQEKVAQQRAEQERRAQMQL